MRVKSCANRVKKNLRGFNAKHAEHTGYRKNITKTFSFLQLGCDLLVTTTICLHKQTDRRAVGGGGNSFPPHIHFGNLNVLLTNLLVKF